MTFLILLFIKRFWFFLKISATMYRIFGSSSTRLRLVRSSLAMSFVVAEHPRNIISKIEMLSCCDLNKALTPDAIVIRPILFNTQSGQCLASSGTTSKYILSVPVLSSFSTFTPNLGKQCPPVTPYVIKIVDYNGSRPL